MYPLAIRTPEFFEKLHPLWPSYFFRDLFRVAEFLGLPIGPAEAGPGRAGGVRRQVRHRSRAALHPPPHAARRARLDLAELDAAAERDCDRIERVIEQNQNDHEADGHWGVPTCAFRGEPFFGQDRLDVLLWRLRQNGLADRAN